MTLKTDDANEMLQLVDPEQGTVDRRMFFQQDIYELELERIFARAWNFMGHDSQIPNPGDFTMTYIGEDRVILVRDNEGNPQTLINSCRHRGNAVCRAEEGHATSFMCTYHGWTYDLQGNLVGVPGFKEVYHEELERESWGLIKAAQVGSYKGFIFACMDPDAPDLPDFLGEVGRMSLDLLAEQGNITIVPGIQKYTIPCNWKLAVDNLFDYYHVGISHSSSTMSGYGRARPPANKEGGTKAAIGGARLMTDHLVLLGEYGHAIGGPMITEESEANRIALNPDTYNEEWRESASAKAALGPVGLKTRGHPNIFPNMWITESGQISMRMPKGPGVTEIWWYTILNHELPAETVKAKRHRSNHTFGPAGMLEQDDGENWGESTKGAGGTVAKNYPLNYAMQIGHGEIINDEGSPPRIETNVNEHGQLWTYRAWAEWMAARNWDELRANHSEVPRDII